MCRTLTAQTIGATMSKTGKEVAEVAEEVMLVARTPWVDKVCEAAMPRLACGASVSIRA